MANSNFTYKIYVKAGNEDWYYDKKHTLATDSNLDEAMALARRFSLSKNIPVGAVVRVVEIVDGSSRLVVDYYAGGKGKYVYYDK